MSDKTVFERIIEGEIPADIVYEDENVLAFLDRNPINKGHTLLVPKEHVDDIHEAMRMTYMWPALVKVANAVKGAFNADGVNILQNNGEAAGQVINHLHFHVVPRYEGEDTEVYIPADQNRSELEDGDEVALQIRQEMAEQGIENIIEDLDRE